MNDLEQRIAAAEIKVLRSAMRETAKIVHNLCAHLAEYGKLELGTPQSAVAIDLNTLLQGFVKQFDRDATNG